ncbi:LysR substrate-binding domain-containing protein [Zoogloeaceae bacterium G21618-S1]|uniref:LysR family transcriptional regulator n=1 Tax=Denitromonas halophila TaxID=1629404 RepID=A0A557QZA8_9RHOO|nr:LysR substrate-binding domain-containing protein [Denitromonas halophila]MCZ4303207.1 LysR substrate-binding domain-containing protein [Zoogloeaceae bacterium G21618-S1]TVO58196.1 LysR family transcriptional regulator [Denitromonas halophila]
MELRQLRYFVRTVELGSISQAALDLGVAQSAISLQIQKLESELSTRLLQRNPSGIEPTEAGLAFMAHAQLSLRHADEAASAAQHSRLSGVVSVGLAPTTAGLLGLPLMQAMRTQYPDIRIRLVEAMSGHLGQMLNGRELDIAVLFDGHQARRWCIQPMLDERLFVIARADASPTPLPTRLGALAGLPLVLPTQRHGLRRVIDTALNALGVAPNVIAEVDSLYVLMDMVNHGIGASVQPWSALARQPDADSRLRWSELEDEGTTRRNLLCSLSEDELSPAALATRNTLRHTVSQLVNNGHWRGVTPLHLESR